LQLHRRRGEQAAAARALRREAVTRIRARARPRTGRRGEPDDDAVGRVARHRRGAANQRGGALRGGGGTAALPHLRYDLLGDPGPAGRGGQAHRRAARSHGRDRGIQLEQHHAPRRDLPAEGADLSRRGRGVHRPAGRNALIAAPTGSGKTFAAFLAAIDSLLRQGLDGALRDETQVVYVSPLKALSNDVQKNLAEPLAEIRRTLEAMCLPDVEIRTLV